MNRKRSPIQKKMMAVIMMTSGIVLTLTSAAFFVYELVTAKQSARRHLVTMGQIVAANSTASLAFQDKFDATETLNSLQAEENIVAACLYDSTGKIFARYPADIPDESLPQLSSQTGYKLAKEFIFGFEPIILDDKVIGTLYLQSSIQEVYDRFKMYGIMALVFIIISFVFAYIISTRLQKSITDPILQLAQTARTVSEHNNYSVRANKVNDDEVGDLTDAFNNMLTRIGIQNTEITNLNQNLEQKVHERTRELEQAIQELKQQTEFADKIFDSTVDLIAVFDTKFRYITYNKPCEILYRMSREEVRGKYLTDLFPATENSGMIDNLKKAREGQMVRQMSYMSPVTHRQYDSFFIPLKDQNDRVYRILTIAHDITDIIQANIKLTALNAELEKSNLELEQFAYVASHDLQEPLRKIQTFSQLGEKNINNTEVLKRYLSKVSSSAQRMTELIKAVLNYSRLSKAGREMTEVDLESVMKNIFTDLELLIEERKAVITYDPLPVIAGIPLQLHQLFLNLITNSLKFSDGEPRVHISCTINKGAEFPNSLQLNNETIYAQLVVKDNGIGFEQKFSEKIFSIFQRLHNDRNFEGTGIGLALCKKIVENHEGAITVQSAPGAGTSFFIYLPKFHSQEDQFTNISSVKK